MKLFLASNRITDHQLLSLQQLLGKEEAEHALCIVTAAVPYGLDPMPEWVTDVLKSIAKVSKQQTIVTLEDTKQAPTSLDAFDLVFVSGGNSFYLAERLHTSGFGAVLRDYIQGGGVYAGSSAGSLILGRNIEPVRRIDNPDAASKIYPGLGLLDVAILPHYDGIKYESAMHHIEADYTKLGQETLGLNDDTILVVNGDERFLVST